MIASIIFKIIITIGVFIVSAYSPRIIFSTVHNVNCPGIQIKFVAVGSAMIVGGFLFLLY